MKRLIISSVLVFITLSAQAATFQITGNEMKTGEQPTAFHIFSGSGCEGGNTSPLLTQFGAPEGTKSFIVTVYDPDTSTGSGWQHQTVASIPATVIYPPTDTERRDGTKLPTNAVQSRNDFGYAGFSGAYPPKGDKPHHYQLKVWALETDKIPVDSNSSGALVGYMLNASKATTAGVTPAYEIKQDKSMLARDKSNLKIEEIRMHKHHEVHRVKPLMPALCRVHRGKKVISWGTHSLTVDNNQMILFPCGYEFCIADYPEVGLYLAEVLYCPISLIEKFQKFYTITSQIRNTTGFCLPQNLELIYYWE